MDRNSQECQLLSQPTAEYGLVGMQTKETLYTQTNIDNTSFTQNAAIFNIHDKELVP